MAVGIQPRLCLIHSGVLCADDAPEAGRMVGFDQVSQFMHDDIVDDEHRSLDKTPVETDVVAHRAGAPAVTIVNYLGGTELDTKLMRVL